jgi:hypothetical protein
MVVGDVGAVALDTDERFYGPPGRALVFSQPPDGYKPRTRDAEQARADMAVRTSTKGKCPMRPLSRPGPLCCHRSAVRTQPRHPTLTGSPDWRPRGQRGASPMSSLSR